MKLGRYFEIYIDKASDEAINIKADKGYVSTYFTDVCEGQITRTLYKKISKNLKKILEILEISKES